MHIFLIGFMGCGKTSIGKRLAKRLKCPFYDTDFMIEQGAGFSIREIFELHGESFFRQIEANTLRHLSNLPKGVVATGGGMPCFQQNMDLINQIGKSFFLSVCPEQLCQRLMGGQNKRPLLQGMLHDEEILRAFIVQKLQERLFFYRQAHYHIDANKPHLALEQILAYLNEAGLPDGRSV